MTRKEREQLRELAKLLFIHEKLSQKEVARRMGVSEQTACRWAQQDKWDEMRVSITLTREEQLRNLYRQLSEINKVISERDQKFATSSEADTISKLASSINKMENEASISDIIEVSKRLLNWLRPIDHMKSLEISNIFNDFIKDLLKR